MELLKASLNFKNKQATDGKYFQEKIKKLRLYENGMNLEEMRQVVEVVNDSVETSFICQDSGGGLKEFKKNCTSPILVMNTMLRIPSKTLSPESPNIRSEKIVVEAEIHHENDWNPPNLFDENISFVNSRNRKISDRKSQADSDVISEIDLFEHF